MVLPSVRSRRSHQLVVDLQVISGHSRVWTWQPAKGAYGLWTDMYRSSKVHPTAGPMWKRISEVQKPLA
jgi:hypothetical protein